MCLVFFFKETATTEIYTYWQTLALHDARPICGLEATLAWSVEAEDGAFAVAARACGLASAEALPAWYGDLMTRCGVERRLPPAFQPFDATTLAAELRATENQPTRPATPRQVQESETATHAPPPTPLPLNLAPHPPARARQRPATGPTNKC